SGRAPRRAQRRCGLTATSSGARSLGFTQPEARWTWTLSPTFSSPATPRSTASNSNRPSPPSSTPARADPATLSSVGGDLGPHEVVVGLAATDQTGVAVLHHDDRRA